MDRRRVLLGAVAGSSLLLVDTAIGAPPDPTRGAALLATAFRLERQGLRFHALNARQADPVLSRHARAMAADKADNMRRLRDLLGRDASFANKGASRATGEYLPAGLALETELAGIYRAAASIAASPALSANLATSIFHAATLRALLVRAGR